MRESEIPPIRRMKIATARAAAAVTMARTQGCIVMCCSLPAYLSHLTYVSNANQITVAKVRPNNIRYMMVAGARTASG